MPAEALQIQRPGERRPTRRARSRLGEIDRELQMPQQAFQFGVAQDESGCRFPLRSPLSA
ncbi:MAG TPA: hypothetical protein DCM05_08060 [Elusimicrobia bacterium]|nr:hypothetical protein [Elusimicrobiota bacterium]